MRIEVHGVIVETIRGDIADTSADALVNAANSELWMGAGVAGAIKSRGGRVIESEAIGKGPIPIGSAVETSAGTLEAKWVIHAAVMGSDLVTSSTIIRSATRSALVLATKLNARSIAMPSLGTGIGGFPLAEAAEIMLDEIVKHAMTNETPGRITLVLYSDGAKAVFDKALSALKSI